MKTSTMARLVDRERQSWGVHQRDRAIELASSQNYRGRLEGAPRQADTARALLPAQIVGDSELPQASSPVTSCTRVWLARVIPWSTS
jgi:hypothetical protein